MVAGLNGRDSQRSILRQSLLAPFLVEPRSFLHVIGKQPPVAGQPLGRFFLRDFVRVFPRFFGTFHEQKVARYFWLRQELSRRRWRIFGRCALYQQGW
mgnify:CR=1 FL=1